MPDGHICETRYKCNTHVVTRLWCQDGAQKKEEKKTPLQCALVPPPHPPNWVWQSGGACVEDSQLLQKKNGTSKCATATEGSRLLLG